MYKKTFFILILAILFFSYCKNDVQLNGKWKDITIVYGLLNQKDSANIHYVKINKAFLGSGNALMMAQNPDSCTYGNYLNVWVEEWKDGSQTHSWTLHDTLINDKQSGTFYYPNQEVYTFKAQLDTNDGNTTYNLYIRNTHSGKLISSSTQLVHKFNISKPQVVANFSSVNPYPVTWNSAVNGKLYQVDIRFNYWEKNLDTGDSTKKYIDWNIGSQPSQATDGTETMTSTYVGNSLFQVIRDNINNSPNVPVHALRRIAVPNVDFIFSVAADAYNTYMEVSAPSTGVLEEKPEFTNINNGIGLFSSRFKIDKSLKIDPYSLDSLINGHYTKGLNFK